MSESIIVVFEYTDGPAIGLRFRETFENQKMFDDFWQKPKNRKNLKVYKAGIPEHEAMAICIASMADRHKQADKHHRSHH